MSSKNLGDDPYERLANAVVLQAVNDYKSALEKLQKGNRNLDAKRVKAECEQFFFSQHFSIFTSIDPSYLVSRLQKEVV